MNEATKQRHVESIKKTEVQGAKLGTEAVKAVEAQEETIAEEVEMVAVSEEKEAPVQVEPTEIAKQEEPKAVDNKICPLCGKELVLRTARYGKYAGREFLGCSGYPKCNYIKNLE